MLKKIKLNETQKDQFICIFDNYEEEEKGINKGIIQVMNGVSIYHIEQGLAGCFMGEKDGELSDIFFYGEKCYVEDLVFTLLELQRKAWIIGMDEFRLWFGAFDNANSDEIFKEV